MVEELKKRFRYNETSKISVLGEPNSKLTFGVEADVGEGYRIKKWDKYIVIDTPASIADERIEKRAQPRTWREELKYLNLFREYYLAYEDALFEEKIIIVNEDIERLKKAATEMAEDIYVSTIKNQNA